MREILFKAKRADNGEWVYGYYVKGLDMYEKEVYLIFEPTTIFYSHGETDGFVEVDPYTVCQYTGLNDKNGQKIWENDIVIGTIGCWRMYAKKELIACQKELEAYREIGTVEELKELKEKVVETQVCEWEMDRGMLLSPHKETAICFHLNPYTKYRYCPGCGKRIKVKDEGNSDSLRVPRGWIPVQKHKPDEYAEEWVYIKIQNGRESEEESTEESYIELLAEYREGKWYSPEIDEPLPDEEIIEWRKIPDPLEDENEEKM